MLLVGYCLTPIKGGNGQGQGPKYKLVIHTEPQDSPVKYTISKYLKYTFPSSSEVVITRDILVNKTCWPEIHFLSFEYTLPSAAVWLIKTNDWLETFVHQL